jgi:hypothetical protein
MPAIQCSATFKKKILSALGPKNIVPKKLGGAETPFVPITCHVIMGK